MDGRRLAMSLVAAIVGVLVVAGAAFLARPWARAEGPEVDQHVKLRQADLATPVPGYNPPTSCPTDWVPAVYKETDEQYIAAVLAPGSSFTTSARIVGTDGGLYEVWSGINHGTHKAVLVVRPVVADPCATPDLYPTHSVYETSLDGALRIDSLVGDGTLAVTSATGLTTPSTPPAEYWMTRR